MKLNIFYPLSATLIIGLGIGVANLVISSQGNRNSQSLQNNSNELDNNVGELNQSLKNSQSHVSELAEINQNIAKKIPDITTKLQENRDKLKYPFDFVQAANVFANNNFVYYRTYKNIKTNLYPQFWLKTNKFFINPEDAPDNIPLNKNQSSAHIPIRFGTDSLHNGQQFNLKSENWSEIKLQSPFPSSTSRRQRTVNKILITHEEGEKIIASVAKEILNDDSELAKNFIRHHFKQRISFQFLASPRLSSPFWMNGLWINRAKEDLFLQDVISSSYVRTQGSNYTRKTPSYSAWVKRHTDSHFSANRFGNSYISDQSQLSLGGPSGQNFDHIYFDLIANPGFDRHILTQIAGEHRLPISLSSTNHPGLLTRAYMNKTGSNWSKYLYTHLASLMNFRLALENTITFKKFNTNIEGKEKYALDKKSETNIQTLFKDSQHPDWTGVFYCVLPTGPRASRPRWQRASGSRGPDELRVYNPVAGGRLHKSVIHNRNSSTIIEENHNLAIWINNDSGAVVASYVIPVNETTPNFWISDFEISFTQRNKNEKLFYQSKLHWDESNNKFFED